MPCDLASSAFSRTSFVDLSVSVWNSFFILSCVSEITSATSATAELTALDNMICIFGLNCSRNLVPSPKTRHGSSGDRRTFPVPGLAESAARATGTNKGSTRQVNKEVRCLRTARKTLGEKPYNLSVHTLGSDQERRASP